MKRRTANLALILGFAAAWVCAARGQDPPPVARPAAGSADWQDPAALRPRLDGVLAGLRAGTTPGLVVADVRSGSRLYARNADVPLKPASVLKLLTTAAALERFGPRFEYETEVYLYGDELWVRGSGDPSLGDERMARRYGRSDDHFFDACAAALRARGATTITKIVLDDTIFDTVGRHPDWPDDQAQRWYQAPSGGLNFNDNCLDVRIVVADGDVVVSTVPDLPSSLFENHLRRGSRHQPILKRRPGGDVFMLTGTVTRSTTLDPVSCHDPTIFFAYALHRALENRGVSVPGPVVRRALHEAHLAHAERIHVERTRLADVIWRCNTYSQNLFADCLLKSLAAYRPDGTRSGAPGSWEAGAATARRTLADLGVDVDGAVLCDGSGLSHTNRVTAAQVAALLVRMKSHPQAAVYAASLAEPGEPGSMRSRYDDPLLRGRVRAKTGTINQVRTLAGYVTAGDGRELAFALLVNGAVAPSFPVDVCKALVQVEPVAVGR